MALIQLGRRRSCLWRQQAFMSINSFAASLLEQIFAMMDIKGGGIYNRLHKGLSLLDIQNICLIKRILYTLIKLKG